MFMVERYVVKINHLRWIISFTKTNKLRIFAFIIPPI